MTKIDTLKLYDTAVERTIYDVLCNKASSLIDNAVKYLTFSIFTDDGTENGNWMVKHPNIESTDPVIEGEVGFYSDYWRLTDYNNGDVVYSEVVTNPNWKDIINAANDMLVRTCEYELFLEGLTLTRCNEYGRKMVRVDFGS